MKTLNFTDSRFTSFGTTNNDDLGAFIQEHVQVDGHLVGYVVRSAHNGDSFHANGNRFSRRNASAIAEQMRSNGIVNIYGLPATN